ncbi:SRPBCC family protein [Roseisolibacter agri]|nr:SRPBCC family protein [Roseisolibacter agri]
MDTALERDAGSTNGPMGGRLGTALGAEARPDAARTMPYQRIANDDRGTGGESSADFLGYFSIGLGLAEALAPKVMTRVIGVKEPDDTNIATMRAMGLREIGHGLAILSNQHPEKAVWSRVAGDMLDLALLGRTMANPENDRGRTTFAIANVLAVTALDVMTARQLSKQPRTATAARMEQGVVRTKRSITVRRPVEEVYAFWHDFENLPRFMRHLESVQVTGDGRSHWKALAPAGRTVEWDAETTDDVPNQCIAWRSLPGADVQNRGVVEFAPAPGGRGTEVRVTLEYDPPLGKLGSKVAMLFREEPGQQVQDDLRHFKQVMETGEIVLSDATKQRGPHPAQPDDKPVQL